MKKIKIKNKVFRIKQLSPLDFIEQDNIPFSLFSCDSDSPTTYDRIMSALNQKKEMTSAEATKRMEHIAVILRKGIDDPSLSVGSLIIDDTVSAVRLYAEIVEYSLARFKKTYKITRNRVFLIDEMAKRYGKMPIDIECPAGGYTELEAWMFNAFVFSVAFNREIEIEKKRMIALRRN